jgi:hypothetical protein
MKVQTVSSRWTFLLKLAFPLLWIIIMGGITLLVIVSPLESLKEPFSPMAAKSLVASFFLLVFAVLYFLFGSCKWVGITDTHLYVSNFFQNFKYTHDSIASIEETNLFLFTKVTLYFHQPGKFGKSVSFIRSHYWKYFLAKHPEVLDIISGNTNLQINISDNQGIEKEI